MQIKVWRDPYDAGFNTTTPRKIDLQPGLTVLVGCNGAGKTTLLRNIQEECKKTDIPCCFYDNLRDGGTGSFGAILGGWQELPCDSMSLGVSLWTASEGEAIRLNIGRQSTLYKEFLTTGHYKNKTYRLSELFNDKAEKNVESNIRVLLFDATDSGLSIDNICDIKALFRLILEDSEKQNLETYIIISANEYELCREEQCFDVNRGKYLTFLDYEAYRKFILESRRQKELRIEKQIAWQEKQKAKELETYKKLQNEVVANIEKIKSNTSLSDSSKEWRIDDEKRRIKNFVRNSPYISEEDCLPKNNESEKDADEEKER